MGTMGEVEAMASMPEFGDGPADDDNAPVWHEEKEGSEDGER